MYLYIEIIKFNFFRFFAYPYEMIAGIGKRIVNIALLILFWQIISQYSDSPVNITYITSYFLLSSAINSFVMAEYSVFGDWISDIIKQGDLSNYLIKPTRILPFLYATYLGKIGLRLSFSVCIFIIGLVLSPPKSVTAVILFIVFLVFAMAISISFNILVAVLTFYITEIRGVKNSVGHFISILSGASAPLVLFPAALREITLLLPFPYMIYGPINALQLNRLDDSVIRSLIVAGLWSIVLLSTSITLWRKGIRKYEAIGI